MLSIWIPFVRNSKRTETTPNCVVFYNYANSTYNLQWKATTLPFVYQLFVCELWIVNCVHWACNGCLMFGDSIKVEEYEYVAFGAITSNEWKHDFGEKTHTHTHIHTGNGQSSSSGIPASSFNYNYYDSTWKRKNLWIKQSFVFCMKNYNCSSHFFWALLRKFITFSTHIVKVSTAHSMQRAQCKRARTENFYYWHLNVEPIRKIYT